MKFLVLSFVFIGNLLIAQERVQLPLSSPSNLVRVINLRDKGLIQLDKSTNGILKIRKFDNNLKLLWDIDTDLGSKVNFLEEFVDNKFIYLLLENRNSENLSILKISTSFAAQQKFDIRTVPNFEVNQFKATDNFFLIGGTVKNDPLLIFLEQGSAPRFISANLKGTSSLQSVEIIENNVYASFLNQSKRKTEAIFRAFNFSGKLLSTQIINSKPEFKFLSTKIFSIKEKIIVLGNYGFENSRKEDFASSQGVFLSNITDESKTKYYNFGEFKNFFNFLSERQKERVEKQVSKKKSKGNEYKFNYRLNINEVLHQGDNLLVSAEVYMPEFRSNNNYNSPFFGSSFYGSSSLWSRNYLGSYWSNNPALWGYNNRSNQYFDGFRYIEGLVLAINPSGELAWDNSVQYKNMKLYDLKPVLKINTIEDFTIASYVKDDKLQIQEFKNDGEMINNQSFDKKLDEKSYKSKNAEFENFEFWYDNYFYNWGITKSNNNDLNTRLSVFIQKMAF